ncbi:hypothetical protein GQ53DRAFT_184683 [Thozetella sp. PMI_491]|nr:hypothetical protein GQ53DRAFT_184683 [Thozetella sp. PMI_491]
MHNIRSARAALGRLSVVTKLRPTRSIEGEEKSPVRVCITIQAIATLADRSWWVNVELCSSSVSLRGQCDHTRRNSLTPKDSLAHVAPHTSSDTSPDEGGKEGVKHRPGQSSGQGGEAVEQRRGRKRRKEWRIYRFLEWLKSFETSHRMSRSIV